ncbi:hypothetical protein B0H13DRAFT_2374532 [Mycena leptocephala]|nr:hypothetical protein B0H13DRAFT_2374532 [Mycena leptocephala]
MSAATLELGAPLDNTMGYMLLGVIMSAILYGISLLQTLFYFTRQRLVLACPTNNLWFTGYDRDPVYLKALVAATVFLDTLHLSFVIHTMYHYLVSSYYNHDALQGMIWSVSLEALPTGLRELRLDWFNHSMPIAYGGLLVSHRNVLLTGAILLLVVATATCGTGASRNLP